MVATSNAMVKKSRIVLWGIDSVSTRVMFHFLEDAGFDVRAVLEKPRSRSELLKARAKRLGWGTVLGQILFQGLMVPVLSAASAARRRQIVTQLQLRTEPIRREAVEHVSSVNEPAAWEATYRSKPIAVVLSGTRIVSSAALQAVSAPIINIHAGLTPKYRGVHGGYWALVNHERPGVTVHLVDEGVDTGEVLAQRIVSISDRDSFATYPLLQLGAALPDLVDVLGRVVRGEGLQTVATSGPSLQWSHPTAWGYVRRRIQSGVM